MSGGARAGVTCFSVDATHSLVTQPLSDLDPAFDEDTSTAGPPGTASQIIFQEDFWALIALTKENPSATRTEPGHIIAWPVTGDTVPTTPVIIYVDSILLEFGSV